MASTKGKKKTKKQASFVGKGKKSASKKGESPLKPYIFPAVLCVVILGCIGFLAFLGYRTVTASEFFTVKNIDIRGTERSSRDDIEKMITAQTQKTGVWNADLIDLKARIEKLTFVKTAAVSRVLPNGIRVGIVERQPQAVVSLSNGDYLIDENGEIITTARKEDQQTLIIRGWDESKTEKALKDNQQRLKTFQKMVADWKDFGLVDRVKAVNLADMQEPKAVIEDSGSSISVGLPKDNFARSLRSAIEAVAGKGQKVKGIDMTGVMPVIDYIQ